MEASESLWFSKVFRWCRNVTLDSNWLNGSSKGFTGISICRNKNSTDKIVFSSYSSLKLKDSYGSANNQEKHISLANMRSKESIFQEVYQ